MPGGISAAPDTIYLEGQKRGRPSALTPATITKFTAALRTLHTVDDAARLAGVHPSTVARWLARGEKAARGEYRDFYEATQKALVEAKTILISRVYAASARKPELALKLLARRYPDEWGASRKVDVTVHEPPNLDQLREKILGRLEQIAEKQRMAAELGNAPAALRQIADTFSHPNDA